MIGRIVILLLAANLAWLAWTQGWLRGMGLGPDTQSEPERVQRQIRPEAVHVQPPASGNLTAAAPPAAPPARVSAPVSVPAPASAPAPDTPAQPEAGAAPTEAGPAVAAAEPVAAEPAALAPPAPAAPPTVCLEAGVFNEQQAATWRRAAAKLPANSWRLEPVQLPGRWMVYIGKLADADAVRAKRNELKELGVDTDRPGSALEPGLSLGRFSTEEAAQRALTDLGRKGVRSARVVQERRDTPAYTLRLPRVDPDLRKQVRALPGALSGKALRACD